MALTPKQEAFLQLWIETGNKSDAYRGAYSCGRMKPETIANKAYQLSNHGEIRARYDQVTQAAQKRNETTIDTIDGMLKTAWTLAKQGGKPSAMVAAAAALARLHGLNKPIEISVTEPEEFETAYARRIAEKVAGKRGSRTTH